MFQSFRQFLRVGPLDNEDEQQLDRDIEAYIQTANSTKFADSNANTDAIHKLFSRMTLDDNNLNNALHQSNGSTHKPINHSDDLKDAPKDNKTFKFHNLLSKHLDLLNELENEADILPGQPVHEGSKFGKDGGSRFVLKHFNIPQSIYQCMRVNNILPLKFDEPLTPQNYVERFRNLLWVEEAHSCIEMRRYDIEGAMLAKFDRAFFLLNVPGLAEGRPSLMRGDKLLLSSANRSTKYEGYIHDVREGDILIKIHESLHNSSQDGLRFDVSFFASRTCFRRQHAGVDNFFSKKLPFKDIAFPNPTLPQPAMPLVSVIEEDYSDLRCFNESMNIHQKRAVINILKSENRPAPYLIFGPCGTGKTSTFVEAVLQVYARKSGSRILVCANSNACVDVLAQRIKRSQIIRPKHLLRVSAFYRMETMIPDDLLDVTKDMSMLDADNYSKYRVVVTTCIQAGALYEFLDKFDYVFIDEAGHASEPEAFVPVGLLAPGGSVVLAGDPHQLGPICMSPVTGEKGLGESLLERLFRRAVYQPKVVEEGQTNKIYDQKYITKLVICYRSDPRVVSVSNELFYDNELLSDVKTPQKWLDLFDFTHPLVFHPVQGKDMREYTNPSWFNPNEAIKCLEYVNKLYTAGLGADQLGIITPYRRQIEKLKLLFDSCNLKKCKIATMEEFQGDERDIIIISTVRSRSKNVKFDAKFNLGFLFNPKRFNVAVTRAKWMVIVIGDPNILNRDPCWIEYQKKAHIVRANQDTTDA